MKPYINCFMYATLDGRIDCAMTEKVDPEAKAYYTYLESFGNITMINGRTTGKMHYSSPKDFCDGGNAVGKESFFKAVDSKSYHVILDTKGSLLWDNTDGTIEGRPILVMTSVKASAEYLELLKKQKVSYIASGSEKIDLGRGLEILNREFGVEKAVLTGGGNVNGSFLEEKLIDEVDMMFGPGIDGRSGWTCAFDGRANEKDPVTLKLKDVRKLENDTVLLTYTVNN